MLTFAADCKSRRRTTLKDSVFSLSASEAHAGPSVAKPPTQTSLYKAGYGWDRSPGHIRKAFTYVRFNVHSET